MLAALARMGFGDSAYGGRAVVLRRHNSRGRICAYLPKTSPNASALIARPPRRHKVALPGRWVSGMRGGASLNVENGCSERAAVMYSLIVTTKMNDVDPQAWLADVLARIADHPAQKLDELLPWNWTSLNATEVAAA